MAHTFHCLIESFLPTLHERMKVLQIHSLEFALSWFTKFFVGYLTNETIFRILDLFILEGKIFLFKAALSILYINIGTLLECKGREEFINSLKYLTKHPDTSSSLFTIACQIEIKKKTVLEIEKNKK